MGRHREAERVGPEEGGRRYYDLLGIFFRHDPVGINFEENVDEYAPEVETVLPRIAEVDGVESLADLLYSEFDEWFSGAAGPRERYLPIAREVWERWQTDRAPDAEYERVLQAWLQLRQASWPPLEGELGDDAVWVSRAITAYLAGFRPIPEWATDVIEDFEAHALGARLPTQPQREFVARLLELARDVCGRDTGQT